MLALRFSLDVKTVPKFLLGSAAMTGLLAGHAYAANARHVRARAPQQVVNKAATATAPLSPSGASGKASRPPLHGAPAAAKPESINVLGRRMVATSASAGTKTDTPLLETTQSVSVVTRAFMTERLVQSIGEALRYAPGVNPDTYGADSRFDWIRIRGFDVTTYGMYLDGMRLTAGTTGPVQEQYGLDRVEVLNGPSSVLYGQAAPGGLVNMVSKKPSSTPYHELQFVAGSWARYQGQFDMTGSIPGTGGSVDGRVVGLVRDADTQVHYVKDNRIYVAPSFTWHITPKDDFTFLSSYLHDHTSGDQFYPAYGTALYNPNGKLSTSSFLGSPDLDKWDRNQYAVGFLYEHRFNSNWRFQQSFRYLGLDLNWSQAYSTSLSADMIHINRLAFREVASGQLYTSDSRLVGHIHTRPVDQTVLLGFDYSRYDLAQDYGYTTGTQLNIFNPVYTIQPAIKMTTHIVQQSEQKGLYFQDQIKITDRILVNLGGRYDWTNTATLTTTSSSAVTSGQNNGVFTYRGGIGYLFPFGLMAYASYARSFQPVTGVNFYGQAFKPTYGKQVEVGAKYQPKDKSSFLTASLFDLTQTNVSQTDPSNALNTIQTGEVRVKGFETSANVSLGSGFDLVFAYTYLDPVIRKSTIGQNGKRPTLIPRNTVSLWGDYQVQPGLVPALTGLGVGMGMRYIGNIEGDNNDTFATPAVTLFDAAVHYDFGRSNRWRIGLNINNLFDKTYVASCSGTTTCYYGQRRRLLGSVRASW
ncbi:hypothetical protein HK28_06975 [Acetobacter sp. DsW_063]|nr:hypothetical protein HK28_06975 [Acetobacter sp. DsW_063]